MDRLQLRKRELIERWKREGIVRDAAILKAFDFVKREEFVLASLIKEAYDDDALPLMKGQTISQPTTVAIMTQLLEPQKGDKILEVGTGSGYQAAILSQVVSTTGIIYTTEIVDSLVEYAKKRLKHFQNVRVLAVDGSNGYATCAPFDRIIVTAACKEIPKALIKQLKIGGIIVAPVGGSSHQSMVRGVKTQKGMGYTQHGSFLFVPLRNN